MLAQAIPMKIIGIIIMYLSGIKYVSINPTPPKIKEIKCVRDLPILRAISGISKANTADTPF